MPVADPNAEGWDAEPKAEVSLGFENPPKAEVDEEAWLAADAEPKADVPGPKLLLGVCVDENDELGWPNADGAVRDPVP